MRCAMPMRQPGCRSWSASTACWFAARGGWRSADAPRLFARYCDRTAHHLANGIAHAITLNEPNLAGKLQELVPPQALAVDKAVDKAVGEVAARMSASRVFTAGNALYVASGRARGDQGGSARFASGSRPGILR